MDVGRSPKPVLEAHASDQRPQFRRDRWPSSAIPGFPVPVVTAALAVREQQRRCVDKRDGVQDRWEPAVELEEDPAITVGQLDAAAYFPLQHNDVLPKRGILERKLAL